MSRRYDAIVIGAGHNGLTAAAYLARSGLSVLVLERREIIGGATVTEEFHPGFRVDAYAHRLGPMEGAVLQQLRLARHGLELVQPDPGRVALMDGGLLPFHRDPHRTAQDLGARSTRDAARWPAFAARLADAARLVHALRRHPPPQLPDPSMGELLRLARVGLGLRRMGRRRMIETLRLLPMSVAELADEWFESDVVKGALAAAGVWGVMQGPRASGTAYALLHHQGDGQDPVGGVVLVRGGMGRLAEALASAARTAGAQLRTSAPVTRITGRPGGSVEVATASGDVLEARCVLSSVDPRRTFTQLVGPERLDPGFLRQVRHIRMRGVCAKVHLALTELPRFGGLAADASLRGAIVVAPGVDYVERAYDDAKYGAASARPVLEAVIPTLTDPSLAPPGRHVMSVLVQYAPYRLRSGEWDAARRQALGAAVVALLGEYAPNLPGSILHRQVVAPPDLEERLGLTEGDVFQGEMSLDQLYFMRPLPGWARYRTPVRGLYLCGAGAHPGGGVTAAPGYQAARAALGDLKSR